MKALLFLPIISLFLFGTPQADPAQRLYDNATTFMNAGNYKEALTDLETILSSFESTPWAPRALLEIGNYYLNVDGDHQKALEYFNRIKKNYLTSDVAAAAFYAEALIVDQHGQTPDEIQAAVSNLIRMSQMFPDSYPKEGALFLFGKMYLRLRDYGQSLSYFQRLEFNSPGSASVPAGLLLSAKAAYLSGQPNEAARILARLQASFPNTPESNTAGAWQRLLDRLSRQPLPLTLDKTFFGGKPKKFQNPSSVVVSDNDMIGILDAKTLTLAPLDRPAEAKTSAARDVSELSHDRDGALLIAYENRVAGNQSPVSFSSLPLNGSNLKSIKSAAIDAFGRLMVVDSSARDLTAFTANGNYVRSFNLNRPKLVRCYLDEIWVLLGDGSNFSRLDGNFKKVGDTPSGLSNVMDFRFDPLGNIYILSNKGAQLSIHDRTGKRLTAINLKSGSYPLKTAQALGVDAGGAVYLADRRGGAVYRFH